MPGRWIGSKGRIVANPLTGSKDGRQDADAEGVAMSGFRSIWWVGLCLGLTGCAVTERRVVPGPGGVAAGGRPGLVAHSHSHFHSYSQPQTGCGCGAAPPPAMASLP